MISSQAGTTVWRWDQAEPFGNSVPNADPDGDGIAFDFPLRFPGQYFDRETNLAYNYFRDYDPLRGQYEQSDPIGLRGGLNTYAYVRSNPLRRKDTRGLFGEWGDPSGPPAMPTDPLGPADWYFGGEGHFFFGGGLTTLTCTDDCGRKQIFRFLKVCFGGAIGASASAGPVLGVSGKQCSADTYKGWFYEAGYSAGPIAAGVDVGYNDDGPGGFGGSLSGVVEGGVGIGLGAMIKSSWCFYIPL